MIRSMTAFARSATPAAGTELVWELRSVNHRFLEVALRLPEPWRDEETALRETAKAQLGRGRLDATLKLAERREGGATRIDETVLAALLALLEQLRVSHPQLSPPGALDVLRWPGVAIGPDLGALGPAVRAGFATALASLIANREREGAALAGVLTERLGQINDLAQALRGEAAGLPRLQRERLLTRIAELNADVDPFRIAQEVTLLAQRSDVHEELDRLDAHVTEFRRALERSEPVGRQLDFLAQELNREANTLASKALTASMSQRGVELKVLIEQIREQVQNVE